LRRRQLLLRRHDLGIEGSEIEPAFLTEASQARRPAAGAQARHRISLLHARRLQAIPMYVSDEEMVGAERFERSAS
jgi:hypothetical protein